MEKIIGSFLKKGTSPVNDCRIAGIWDVFSFGGLGLSDESFFLPGRGLDFHFIPHRHGSVEVWLVNGLNPDFGPEFLENTGVKINEFVSPESAEFWPEIARNLDNDVPLLAAIDSSSLGAGLFNSFYGNAHIPVVGYDYEEKSLYLKVHPDLLHKVRITEFVRAVNSEDYPYRNRRGIFSIGFDAECLQKDLNYGKLLIEGLTAICRRMLGEEKTGYGYRGVGGMRFLARKLNDYASHIGRPELDKQIMSRLFRVRFKLLWKGASLGSDSFYRDEFGKILMKMSGTLENPQLAKTGEGFLETGKLWRYLTRLLVVIQQRAGSSYEDQRRSVTVIAGTFNDLAEREEKLFGELYECLGNKIRSGPHINI